MQQLYVQIYPAHMIYSIIERRHDGREDTPRYLVVTYALEIEHAYELRPVLVGSPLIVGGNSERNPEFLAVVYRIFNISISYIYTKYHNPVYELILFSVDFLFNSPRYRGYRRGKQRVYNYFKNKIEPYYYENRYKNRSRGGFYPKIFSRIALHCNQPEEI